MKDCTCRRADLIPAPAGKRFTGFNVVKPADRLAFEANKVFTITVIENIPEAGVVVGKIPVEVLDRVEHNRLLYINKS